MNERLMQIARESVAQFEANKGRDLVAADLRRGIYDGWERVQCSYIALQLINRKA